jgi:hypothetical protein
MLQRHIKKKIPIRLTGLGMMLFLAFVCWMVHPPNAEAALLDLLPDISVNTPVVSVDVPSIHLDTPVVHIDTPVIVAPTINVEIPPVKVETPVLDIHLPSVPVTVQPKPAEISPPIKHGNTDETRDKPATKQEKKEPSVPAVDPKEKPIDVTPAKLPSAVPVQPKPVHTVSIRKHIHQHHKKHIDNHQAAAFKSAETSRSSRSSPIPDEPQDPWPANSTAVLTGSAPTSGGGLSAGTSRAAYAGNPGLLFPEFLLQPPSNVQLYYERSHLFGANQWSKPPPVEPPRYTLLLM